MERLGQLLANIAYIAAIVLVFLAIIVINHFYEERNYCVVLPNGYMIGYSSILNPSPNGLYRMVLRDPTGNILIRSDFDIQFVRHPVRHDRVIARFPRDIELDLDGEKLMPAILHLHPYSLIKEDPKYSTITWSEISRELSKDESLGWYGAALVHQKLMLSPNFKRVDYGTPWFNWSE